MPRPLFTTLQAFLCKALSALKEVLRFRPNTLHSYLFVQNLFLAALCLGIGTCIYLLQDLIETLDAFVGAGVGPGVIIKYFFFKLPLILSQILPAAYLVCLIVQLGLLVRHRELLALQAGGISFVSLVKFFFFYGVFWFVLQLVLAQGLAVAGQEEMERIWREDLKKGQAEPREVRDVWFLSGPFVVNLERALPEQGRGLGVHVYVYGEDNTLREIITAEGFEVRGGGWELREVTVHETITFRSFREQTLFLEIAQDLSVFGILQARLDFTAMSLWQLGRVISHLEGTGSNVERLRTAWHMKWAYAFSLLVMTLIALALATIIDNVYVNIALGLGIVFVYHVLFVLGVSLGERGFLSPFVGAWLGNFVFCLMAGGRLMWHLASQGHSPAAWKRPVTAAPKRRP